MTKVLITVKTYPAISTKYGETVCTAGITEEGKWIRIYPLPFRRINYKNRFKKYEWIELDLKRNTNDFRPESYRPLNFQEIKSHGIIEADGGAWTERRKIVLQNVYTNLDKLITEAKDMGEKMKTIRENKSLSDEQKKEQMKELMKKQKENGIRKKFNT